MFTTTVQLGHDNKRAHLFSINNHRIDETYTLYATKNIKNKLGKKLNKGVFMSFFVDVEGKHPDKTSPQKLSGLHSYTSGNTIKISWNSSTASDLAGYHVYYKIEGEKEFVKLDNTTNADNLFYTSTIELTKFLEQAKGKKVDCYVTAVDKSQNESIPSDLITVTFTNGGTDPRDTTPPAAPTCVTIKALNNRVEIDWHEQYEPDLA